MSDNRLYSDQEISAILKRAGEIQATQSDAETHGLSLEELQAIAAEVGLDPRLVAAAAAELERVGAEEKGGGLLGAPTSLYIERVVPGEIDGARWSEVAAKIGEAFNMVGRSGQVGDALEWTHTSERSNLQVTVIPGDGQTKIRVVGQFARVALSFFLPSLVVGGIWGGMIAMASGIAPAISLSIWVLLAILAFFLARFGYSRYVHKREQAAENLARSLVEITTRPSKTAASEKVEPLLDSMESDQPEEERFPGNRARGRTR